MQKVQPDFDNDSPTEYVAKLDRLERFTKNTLARNRYLIKNGLMKRGERVRPEVYDKIASRKSPPLNVFEETREFNESLRKGEFADPVATKKAFKTYLLRESKGRWKLPELGGN